MAAYGPKIRETIGACWRPSPLLRSAAEALMARLAPGLLSYPLSSNYTREGKISAWEIYPLVVDTPPCR